MERKNQSAVVSSSSSNQQPNCTTTTASASNPTKNAKNTNGTSSNNKSLLIRLSEACNRHKLQHEERRKRLQQRRQRRRQRQQDEHPSAGGPTAMDADDEVEEENNNEIDFEEEVEKEFRQCTQDLKILKDVIPRVEAAYRLPKQTSSASTSSTSPAIHENDLSNLCMFYHSIVMGSFCPHSKQILLQSGIEHGIDGMFLLSFFFLRNCVFDFLYLLFDMDSFCFCLLWLFSTYSFCLVGIYE